MKKALNYYYDLVMYKLTDYIYFITSIFYNNYIFFIIFFLKKDIVSFDYPEKSTIQTRCLPINSNNRDFIVFQNYSLCVLHALSLFLINSGIK